MDLYLLLLLVLLGGCSFGQSEPCTGYGCQCIGDVNIDLNGFFYYPVLGIPDNTPGNEKYTYSFSPCVPLTYACYTGQANTALCQYDSTNPSGAVSLGSTQDISWSVTSEDEFTLTITGGTPAYGPYRARESTITFQYMANISENEITYLGETTDETKIIYKFAVQFTTTHTSGGDAFFVIISIVIIILVIVVMATFLIVGGLLLKKVRRVSRQRGYQDL